MVASREVAFYGATNFASGLGLLTYSWLFLETTWAYIGLGSMFFGIAVFSLSLLREWGPWERPLGITLLGLGYCFGGLVTIVVGGWLFSPLLLLAIVFFAIAWGLLKRKSWARISALLISGVSVLVYSVIGTGPFIPYILGYAYLSWYLHRPHVTSFFSESAIDFGTLVHRHRRYIILISIMALLLALGLSYSYINPPTSLILSRSFSLTGSPGGAKGTPPSGALFPFFARGGDLLMISFVNDGEEKIRLCIESEKQSEIIVDEVGINASALAKAPFTSEYRAYVNNIETTHISGTIKISVQFFSLRRSLVQCLFLDFCAVALLFYAISTSKS